jgi:hypothetical protein
MKRIIVILLVLAAVASVLVGCNSSVSDTSPVTEGETTAPDLNADARVILNTIVEYHLADDEFVDTILTQVPDAFMLVDYRAACWTYFLVMSDGIEYIVITDYDGHIISISYWDPVACTDGETIYTDSGGNE